MSKILKGIGSEGVFKGATLSALVILLLFIVGVIVSLLTFTDWSAFIDALLSTEILFAIRLSLATATISTIIAIIMAIPIAYTISYTRFPGKDIVDSLLDLPIVISPVALGAALLVFFNTPLGSAIDDNIIKIVFSVPGIVVAQVVVVSALAIRLLKSTFDSIDPRYEQVGRTLGLSKGRAFIKITLPMAKDGLIAATILTWARAIGEYGASVTLAGATAMKTETLPIAISLSLASANVERAIAIIFILVIIAVIALITMRKITGKRYSL